MIRALLALTIVMEAFVASASAQDAFPIPSIDWAKGIHGHGDVLWVAASNQGLLEIARGGSVTRIPNIRSAIAVGGHEDTVVTAGYDEQLWRRRNGRWERGPVVPEIRFGDGVQAIVVAENGDVYIAARYALHVWRGNRALQTFNAERELQTVAVAKGRVFTGGRDSIYELRDDSLQNTTFHDALRDELGGRAPRATGLWVDQDEHLWIGLANRKLAEVDLDSNRVSFHTHPLFGSVRSFASAGGRLVIGAQSEMGVLEGTGFRQFGTRLSFPEGFYLDGSTLYVTNRDGLTAIDVGAGSPIVRPVAQITTSSMAASMTSSMTSSMSSMAQASGVRVENLNASGCGLIGAMAIAARAQEAAGQCVATGQSVSVRMTLRNGRPTSVAVTSDVTRARACAQRRLRRMRVPGAAPSCEVTLDIAH